MKISKKILHSKWTSLTKKYGYRHFEVINFFITKQMIELYAVCDKSYTILITYQELQSTNLWVTGLRTLK